MLCVCRTNAPSKKCPRLPTESPPLRHGTESSCSAHRIIARRRSAHPCNTARIAGVTRTVRLRRCHRSRHRERFTFTKSGCAYCRALHNFALCPARQGPSGAFHCKQSWTCRVPDQGRLCRDLRLQPKLYRDGRSNGQCANAFEAHLPGSAGKRAAGGDSRGRTNFACVCAEVFSRSRNTKRI